MVRQRSAPLRYTDQYAVDRALLPPQKPIALYLWLLWLEVPFDLDPIYSSKVKSGFRGQHNNDIPVYCNEPEIQTFRHLII
jgi:hypothetical protein